MARLGKWVESQSDEPVGRVAARALAARFDRVWHFMRLSAEKPDNVENVHQLRVFTRRAAAAMDIFDLWLPKHRAATMRKRLKQIRNAAGQARDLDVLEQRISKLDAELPAHYIETIRTFIRERREEAQLPIRRAYEKLVRKRFVHKSKRLTQRMHGTSHGEQFARTAEKQMAELAAAYLHAGNQELGDAHALHAFRIEGKRVRYAMEIFAGAFSAEFRQELYPVVASLQEKLGDINDHVTAEAYLTEWRQGQAGYSVVEALEALWQLEHTQLEAARREFLAWWTSDRRAQLQRGFSRFVALDQRAADLHRDRAG
jgi:CHAD domain-containing protein